MSYLELIVRQDGLNTSHTPIPPKKKARISGEFQPNGQAILDKDGSDQASTNTPNFDNQTGLESSSSYVHSNGHFSDTKAVNGRAVSTSSAPSDGFSNGHSVNGETSNGIKSEVINASSQHSQTPIAICGMALRLPAGLKTPQQLWEFLLAKGDARSRVPPSRYNIAAFHDPGGKHGTVITEFGYFLDDDIGALDTSFFSMPRMEVERTDPQQRIMLETTRECLEDAGEIAWRGKRIGCYMGSLGEDWCEMFARETQNWGPYRYTGFGDFALSNRVSYEMDLQGPSMTTRTACSASLVALHEACVAISRGDCNSAVVGGANLIMTPGATMSMTEQNVLSKDGSCKTFSADANGYARGEAVATLYVKRLDEALKDGNPIRAIIRGTATNHDGKTTGMTVPSAKAQEMLMRRAYKVAGITDFSKTGFVECHGTGTPVGDPIETRAVGQVFGEFGVYIGSVKPNFGHTEGASGLLSVIKAVLALEHSIIPPNIKFSRPNPAIPFESAKLTVPTEPTPWPQNRLKRASVNSFGVGGTNAHVVIDSMADSNSPTLTPPVCDEPRLLLLSANSQKALTTMVGRYHDFAEKYPQKVRDLAYTLANRREHLPHRTFVIASKGGVGAALAPTKSAKPPSLVMVFTGQGAQWPQMGRDLLDSNKTFLQSIQRLDQYLQGMDQHSPEWRIEAELRKPGKRSRVHLAEFSQPLCTAVQIALVDALAAIGVKPDAVVGHSSGEIAGAYASGALTAKEAIVNAKIRGAVTNLQKRPGAMAALSLSWEEAATHITSDMNVSIACDNSPKSVTISGDTCQVEAVLADIRRSRPGVMARKLQVDKAYHSFHMVEVGQQYHSLLENRIDEKEPLIPFFSSVTGSLLESMKLGPKYWQRNMESPVLFKAAISNLLQHSVGKHSLFLEIGPHAALAAPLRQICVQASSRAPYTSVLVRNQNCIESMLSAVGKLFTHQYPLDLKALIPNGTCLSDLPPYPWDHDESYWYESRLSKEYRLRNHPHHDLLGARVLESTDFEPSWRNLLHINTVPWVRDHKVGDDIIFPFAAYAAMAGEAVRQITGKDEVFRLRHVIVSTALVIPEGKPVEVITNLRPCRLTDTLNSKWWKFTVASHNGHTWTKHCTGEAMAQSQGLGLSTIPVSHPRTVEVRQWFDTLRRSGLDLGPAFRNLGNISASTTAFQATAKMLNHEQAKASEYHIFPTVVDSALQLMGVAVTNGEARKFKNRLPTGCDDFSISRSCSDFIVGATAKFTVDSVIAEAQGVADGHVVLSISGLKLSAVDKSDALGTHDTHAAARLKWGPDIDFTNTQDLFKPIVNCSLHEPLLDSLFHLCLTYSQRTLAGFTEGRLHLQKYSSWISDQAKLLELPSLCDVDNETIAQRIDSIVCDLIGTPMSPAAIALQQVCRNLSVTVSGQGCTWEDLLPSETTMGLRSLIDACDMSSFIQQLAHCKPNLRVLEIGAWRTAPSGHVLESLTLPNGQTLYSKYTFTSKGFISMQESQAKFPKMEYATLDINQDPLEQGFHGHHYDLVIASNAVHNTHSISASLQNIRKLLHPAGHLLLQELGPVSKWINYVFGNHPQWWCGLEDGRLNEPYLDAARWQGELLAAGFQSLDPVLPDPADPSQLNSIMIAKPSVDRRETKRVSLLCHDKTTDPGPILHGLRDRGYEVMRYTIHDLLPPGQDIVALLDCEEPFFENIDLTALDLLKRILHNLNGSGIFWVARPSQIHCRDPRFAQTIGAARSIRSELLVDFATCEVDDISSSAAQILQVFTKFQQRDLYDQLKPDFEYAIHKGVIKIGRFYPFPLSDNLLTSTPGDGAMLDISIPGRPSTLHWVRKPASVTLEPDEVEVEVYAVGLNFRDVLIAMNIVQLPQGRVFGLEGAGVVRRVGSGVKSLRIGDRVAVVEHNMFATIITTLEALCVKIPDDLTFSKASTMFFPYITAMHSLMDVGGLEKGQSVLIHSACGGVGIAAIQLAQMIGADVYATVSSDQKVRYLMETFKIPRNRIFNSRDDTFVKGVMHETRNDGVDLVLNSLSGELLHATWECVAPFGKMVEIGKRDLLGFGKLDMNVFLANRSYCCVDADAFRKKPAMMNRLLIATMNHFREGRISPIRPVEVFDAASPYNAFRYMQPGQHIGRICLSLREAPESSNIDSVVLDRPISLELCGKSSYLLVGGLGGLGRAVSTWMVEHGARHLIYLSRNAGSGPEDESFVRELNSMGCQVQLVQGSVIDLAVVNRAIEGANYPLKGILQMSMVLRDENFSKMTLDQWNAAVQPKVQGTWNLHNACASASLDLDFFVLFSSLSGIIGQPGQANYASGNTFLDAFVQYRNSLGLAASAIDIGAVAEVGYISQNRDLMQKMAATGFKALKEQEVLDALLVAMTRGKPTINEFNDSSRFVDGNNFVLGLGSTIPLNSPANRAIWKHDRRMAINHNIAGGDVDTATSSASLKLYIASAKADTSILRTPDAAAFFAREIGKKLFAYLLKPEEDLNTSLSLADLGMDSLVGIELRSWWKQAFGFDISVLEMLGMGTLEALGQHAAERLMHAALAEQGA